ncbi:unnamed protein product [Calicophoron daubneyi]|uniref:Uncharacterized protein n=1 Tax=Calicophoron daubneyi TaxID=300641 RepID=A0AAV2TDY4_CALDB
MPLKGVIGECVKTSNKYGEPCLKLISCSYREMNKVWKALSQSNGFLSKLFLRVILYFVLLLAALSVTSLAYQDRGNGGFSDVQDPNDADNDYFTADLQEVNKRDRNMFG